MKTFLAIVAGAVVSFQLVAIAQEWDVFASAWFGATPSSVPQRQVTPGDRASAEQLLKEFHALARHLYASGADPRFGDRLPASPAVVGELLADIAYLQHSGMAQEPRLMRLELVDVKPFGAASLVASTREYWVTQLYTSPGHVRVGEPRAQVVFGAYRLDLEAGRWRIGEWDLGEPTGDGATDGGP